MGLDVYMLIGGNVLLLFPLIMAIAIFYAIHINRFEFTKSFQKWAYLAILSLVLIVISIFREIIPIIRSLSDETLQSFFSLYLERAAVHPVSVIFLTLCFLWMHRKSSQMLLFPFVFFLLVFVFVEIIYLGRQLAEVVGETYAIIIGIPLIIFTVLCIHFFLKN